MTAHRQDPDTGPRSDLTALLEAISRRRSEHQAVIAQYNKLRAFIKAEADAQAKLDEIKRHDAQELAELLIGSSSTHVTINHGEQSKAERELARARREADVARACETAVVERMAESSRQIDGLELHISPLVVKILLDDARALAAEINAETKRLRAKYSRLWGLRRYVGEALAIRKRLNDVPMPIHPDHIAPDAGELMTSAAAWRSYATRLAADPKMKFKE